jgi:ABC-2 type transport system permease protein
MGTYLFLLNKLFRQHKLKILFTILFPFAILWILIPFLTKTVEESSVPIALVNSDVSEFSKIVKNRIEENPRIELMEMELADAQYALMTGKVEATFQFTDDFEENIRAGEIRDQINWYRTENSFLDTFVKERIAAEVMRLTLNSKAANEIIKLTGDESEETWQHSFDFSESYWDPEPLFAMEFIPYTGKIVEISDEDNPAVYALFGFWLLFIWLIFSALIVPLYHWQEKGLIERISLVNGNSRKMYSSYYGLTIGISLIFLWLINWVTSALMMEQSISASTIFRMVIVAFIIFLLTVGLQQVLRKRTHFLIINAIYAIFSFTFSVISVVSNTKEWWHYLLPHTWFYELIL